MQHKRVLAVGPVPYHEVPRYLSGFDFCILPWKTTRLVKSVDPIKIYEYLASGAPVITAYWNELEQYRGIINFAGTSEEYEKVIETELAKPEYQRREEAKRRVDFVKGQTWQARADEMQRIFITKMSERTKCVKGP